MGLYISIYCLQALLPNYERLHTWAAAQSSRPAALSIYRRKFRATYEIILDQHKRSLVSQVGGSYWQKDCDWFWKITHFEQIICHQKQTPQTRHLTRGWQGGGLFFAPPLPSHFSAISPKVTNGSSLNFQYPPSHQFDTSWQKENSPLWYVGHKWRQKDVMCSRF